MNAWKYEIRDKISDKLLYSDTGFESESDALIQGDMEAKADNIKNYYIRTFQEWIDL